MERPCGAGGDTPRADPGSGLVRLVRPARIVRPARLVRIVRLVRLAKPRLLRSGRAVLVWGSQRRLRALQRGWAGVLLLAFSVLSLMPAAAQPVLDPPTPFSNPTGATSGATLAAIAPAAATMPPVATAAAESSPTGPAGMRAERRADLPPTEASLPAEVIVRALTLMGIGYRWGGNIPETGMDCSGFVRHVFHEAAGLMLPRRSEDMSRSTVSVGKEYLLPGDLVFFNTQRRGYSHVGIYLGDEKFVHAPAKGKPIRIDSMRERYWIGRYDGARRVMGELPSQDPAALDQVIELSLSRLGVALLPESTGTGGPATASASRENAAASTQVLREVPASLSEAPAGSREGYGWRAAAMRAHDAIDAAHRAPTPSASLARSREWRTTPAGSRNLASAAARKQDKAAAKPKRPTRRT